MSSSSFSPSVLTIPSLGLGEINIVTNGIALANTSGWTTNSATLTRQSNGSPLDPAIPTGFQAVSTTTTASYVATTALSVPISIRNRKLKLQFNLSLTDSASWKVDVFKSDNTTRYTLTTDSSGVSAIPALTGTFTTTFDMDSDTAIYVRFTRYGGSGTSTLNFTNLIVGTGVQPQGAVVQEWQSYTPTISNLGSGTVSTSVGYYRRVGSALEAKFTFTKDATGGTGASTVTVSLPAGVSIDFTKISTDEQSYAGSYDFRNGSSPNTNNPGSIKVTSGSSTTFYFQKSGGTVAALTGADFPGTARIEGTITLPIAEWAGSGTVQLAQNDVEYASNDGSGGTAASTQYATGMVYGPGGSNFVSVNSTTLNASTDYLVRFQTPIQQTDVIQIEIQDANGTWTPVTNYTANAIRPYQNQATSYYGMGWYKAAAPTYGATDIWVVFGNYGTSPASVNGTAFAATGSAWSTVTGRKWRVRKSSAGAAVGFGIVNSQSAGLLPSTNGGLDDATATRLGLKQYLHGTNYNGGNAPTVTLNSGGGTLTTVRRASFIPYQTQDGAWRLRFNVLVELSSISRTGASVAVNGITTKNVTNLFQPISSCQFNSVAGYVAYQYVDPNSNLLNCTHATATSSIYGFSGDVELESKPTWAY